MTTDQAATSALAIRDGQEAWTPIQLAAFKQLGMDGAPDADLAVFLYRCQVTRLDPFAKQIRLRKDKQKVNGQWEDRWSIETEIEGYRVIAQRAAKRDGVTLHYGDPIWYGPDEDPHLIWLRADPPAGASFTVYKDGQPFKGTVAFTEFANMKDGRLLANWGTMPAHMIAKCAEALALRMAFPQDLQGIHTTDETPAADPQITVTHVHNPEPAPKRVRPDDAAKLRALIAAEFDRLGLDDAEERKVYVFQLANKEPGEPLTDSDLRFVWDSLRYDPQTGDGCEDLAALIDLCAVEVSS
jgi:phage recombination protein Bet